MYLSQLTLDCIHRQSMRCLSDVYRLHQLVMSGFSKYDQPSRVLFRVEPEIKGNFAMILVQSVLRPEWEKNIEVGKGLAKVDMKEFSPQFRSGNLYRFRLRVNPVVTREGKRYGLIRDETLVEWFRKRGERIGVSLKSLIAIDEGYATGTRRKGDKVDRINIKIARFEGLLEVIDQESFYESFNNGVGHAKSFGCGLISLARV